MRTKRTFLPIALSAVVLTTALTQAADLQPAEVINLTGTLVISQNIPCSNIISVTTPVTGGRIELAPAEGVDIAGNKVFVLSRADISFSGFTATGSCLGFSDTEKYTQVAVELSKAVSFAATPGVPGVYNVTIPKADFVLYEASIVNGSAKNGYLSPDQDVTGTIDLNTGAVTVHVVIGTSVHFHEGLCPVCVDETDSGTMTADISGTIAFPDTDGDGFPDRLDNCPFAANPSQALVPTPIISAPPNITIPSCSDHQIGIAFAADACFGGPITVTNNAPATFVAGANPVTWTATDSKSNVATATQTVTVVEANPPTVSCEAVHPPLGNSFQVSTSDNNGCAPPTIRLGSYVLANDEVVMIQEVGKSGVTLINTPDGIRHFHVGKGQAIVTATDGSGNVSSAICQ